MGSLNYVYCTYNTADNILTNDWVPISLFNFNLQLLSPLEKDLQIPLQSLPGPGDRAGILQTRQDLHPPQAAQRYS